MSTLETVLLVLLIVDALALTTLVLLQQGKGADVGAAFGSGSSNTMFGSSGGATFMTRVTTWLAVGFFVIAFGLAYTAKERAAAAGQIGIPQVVTPASEQETPVAPEDQLDDDIPQL
ncbi:MAG: preprotein translocase subunit SecG, partial [Pseudomonadota bacterium]|nr:preprotein translocase subunit SecG [Pseudomonadota bacterium]